MDRFSGHVTGLLKTVNLFLSKMFQMIETQIYIQRQHEKEKLIIK